MNDFWKGKRVVITGGCSFIGSHLTEAVAGAGAIVLVVDDLSSGRREHIALAMQQHGVVFIQGDLRDIRLCRTVLDGQDVVFHLAAVHGGRGFVHTFQASCSENFGIDSAVIQTAAKKSGKLVFASSGCVYPNMLQQNPDQELYLTEDMVGGRFVPYDCDGTYGYAKAMAELTLRALRAESRFPSVSLRYFTVIGPRMKEDHAIGAMIGRAFIRQDPFEIWGAGDQVRNWTYVDDIVRGTLLAAEKVEDAQAINLGTMERTTVLQAAKIVCAHFDYLPRFNLLLHKPAGPLNRVADNTLAQQLMNWDPEVPFVEGVRRTVAWYKFCQTIEEVSSRLTERALLGR